MSTVYCPRPASLDAPLRRGLSHSIGILALSRHLLRRPVIHFTDSSLRLFEQVPTKTDIEFSPWWQALNAELTKRSWPEALSGSARGYYETAPEATAAGVAAQA